MFFTLKLLFKIVFNDSKVTRRLFNTSKAVALIKHPNIKKKGIYALIIYEELSGISCYVTKIKFREN